MNRKLTPLILPFFLFSVCATGFAQQTSSTARRSPRAQKPGSYLIVWTQTQAPEPAPQPSGRQTTTPDPKPETQSPSPAQPAESQPEGSQSQGQPAAQSFTGTIGKEGDSYVLKVSDTSSYKLDDQDKAKEYEGKRVSVVGILDPNTNLIRVQKIEPIS